MSLKFTQASSKPQMLTLLHKCNQQALVPLHCGSHYIITGRNDLFYQQMGLLPLTPGINIRQGQAILQTAII